MKQDLKVLNISNSSFKLCANIFSFLKLIRLPNIFTAISNVWAGAVIVNGGNIPFPDLLFATVASASLYGGGIALNDYNDRNLDRLYRLERPIPSGLISEHSALLVAGSFLALGAATGFMISKLAGFITIGIALSVILYDSLLKKWFLPGIVSMGMCRGLNWTFGLETGNKRYSQFIFIPIAIFIYIAALTAIARSETEKPVFKKIVASGIIFLPLIDGFIVLIYGYWWQALIVSFLVVPTIMFSKMFDVT